MNVPAERDLRLALGRMLPRQHVPKGEPRVWLLLDLAALSAAQGDEAGAAARVAAARAEGLRPERVEDLLAARPGIGVQ